MNLKRPTTQQQQQQQQHRRRQPLNLLPLEVSNDVLLQSISSSEWLSMASAVATAAATTTTSSSSSAALVSSILPAALAQSALVTQLTTLAQQGGPLVMTLAVALSDAIPLVPTQPISLLAGALFGFQLGLPAVMLGQAMATLFAFYMGRYVLQQHGTTWWTSKLQEETGSNSNNNMIKINKVLKEMTSGLNTNDWKTVFWTIFVARQSPVLPFSLGNYFVGSATQAPLVPALLGTIAGCFPLNCVWVGAGAGGMAALGSLRRSSSSNGGDSIFSNLVSNPQLAEGLEVIGVVATLAIVVSIGQAIVKAWNDDDDDQENVEDWQKPLMVFP